VRGYLTVQHRDNPDDGCPSAALLDEIGRCTDATKQAYTDGVLVIVDGITARLAPDDPRSARVKPLSVFAMMVGTLQLSRALADQQLTDQVLEEGIQNALVLLGAEPQSSPRQPGHQRCTNRIAPGWPDESIATSSFRLSVARGTASHNRGQMVT
jgi:TetR/AcrR family transcriptional regulator, transcriptional repressor for nem operon